jgi:FkbM family methyltransferase
MAKPLPKKIRGLRYRFKRLWNQLMPWLPLPTGLPYGGWWLARNDVCGDAIFAGGFEEAERRFVEDYLKAGMTVLDIGAHGGYYTLLASRKVGRRGRVIAFEPSPRERQRLYQHLRINRCSNVLVERAAVSSYEGEAEFFFVDGRDTGCNSLRPPVVADSIRTLPVPVVTLDSALERLAIDRVDFLKMDVEGGELEVLKGAIKLLSQSYRPLILCEVADVRTAPWGYKAREIILFLVDLNYSWFLPLPERKLRAIRSNFEAYSGNFLAVPCERTAEIRSFLKEANEA